MTLAQQYNEHPAAALVSCLPHMKRLGATLSGIVANDAHHYGYHLSPVRLNATGQAHDYSLQDPWNTPVGDMHAACAIDIGFGWRDAGEWLEAVRKRCKAGLLPQVAELIGDPDLIPGPKIDGVRAMYTSAEDHWEWTTYDGEGHTAWCHVGVGRRFCNWDGFGDALFGWWPVAPGPITTTTTSGGTGDMSQADIDEFRTRLTRLNAQLDEVTDTVFGGQGPAYRASIMRRDHGHQMDAINRHVDDRVAELEQQLAGVRSVLDQVLAAVHPQAG